MATRLPASLCAKCGYEFSAATELETGTTPKPGDISICVECQNLAVFDADLRVVPLPPEKLPSVQANPKVEQAVLTMRAARAEWKRLKKEE